MPEEEEEKSVRGEDFVLSMAESPLTPLDEIMPPNGVGALLFRLDIETSSSM